MPFPSPIPHGRAVSVCCLLLLLAAPGEGRANIFADAKGQDPRTSVPRTSAPPIGIVGSLTNGQVKASGTGFMVGPCYMATALHVVPPELRGKKGPKVVMGDRRKAYPARLVASGGSVGDAGDWALLRVSGCPGKAASVGWMGLDGVHAGPWARTDVASAGYPFARGVESLTFERCRILGSDAAGRQLVSDCSVSAGASGSPLYRINDFGVPVAVAVVMGELQSVAKPLPAWDPQHTTVAVALSQALWRDAAAADLLIADWKKAKNPLADGGSVLGPRAPQRP